MSTLFDVLLFTSIGSVLSLIGGVVLLANKKSSTLLQSWAAPFAAGALLAAAFTHLLPEIIESGISAEETGIPIMLGILIFFVFERFIRYFHHHHEHDDEKHSDVSKALVITGDTVHNFIDGVVIAAAFSLSYSAGVATTLAVVLHEIPQEIGDFGLLLRAGMRRLHVLAVNLLSAITTVVGALFSWYFIDRVEQELVAIVVGLTAGFFIYIALSDVIPSIHRQRGNTKANLETLFVMLGALVVMTASSFIESI